MQKPVVSITKFEDPDRSVAKAVKLIGGIEDLDRPSLQVIIKPGIFDPTRPPYTDVRLAKAVARLFHLTKDISFAESDNLLRTSMEALRGAGYDEVSRVGLVDLSSSLSEVRKTRERLLQKQRFSKILLHTDVLVSVPVMKSDPSSNQISVGVKNLFGLIPDKVKSHLHGILDEVLVELLRMFKPRLTVVDAVTTYVGRYPSHIPVRTGLIVAGRDVVAVDTVCAKIMGISPANVRHLSLAVSSGIGTNDLKDIDVVGVQLSEASQAFSIARTLAEKR